MTKVDVEREEEMMRRLDHAANVVLVEIRDVDNRIHSRWVPDTKSNMRMRFDALNHAYQTIQDCYDMFDTRLLEEAQRKDGAE